MHLYCEAELRLSEDAAYKRIHAARVARNYPHIFEALADGRLNVTTVNLLSTYLTKENAAELLKASEFKSKSMIEHLLAERFPRSEALPLIETISVCAAVPDSYFCPDSNDGESVSASSCQLAPERVEERESRSSVTPLAAQRYTLQLSIGQEMRDDLEHAKNLLGHEASSPDIATLLHRGLKALIRQLEKRKFSATDRPRPCRSVATPGSRYVPAEVQRTVWVRDGGQCTFIGENGKRCPARRKLEFDHILEVARGGRSTASNVRLSCKAHNQYRAELTYGSGFMEDRRQEHRVARDLAAAKDDAEQVTSCMRRLGFTADESRRAAAHACTMPNASLEARVRAALSYLVPPRRQDARSAPAAATASESIPAG